MTWNQRLFSALQTGSRRAERGGFRPAVVTLEDRSVPAAFTAGDIVVTRVGTGVGSLGSTAAATFLDEYTPGRGGRGDCRPADRGRGGPDRDRDCRERRVRDQHGRRPRPGPGRVQRGPRHGRRRHDQPGRRGRLPDRRDRHLDPTAGGDRQRPGGGVGRRPRVLRGDEHRRPVRPVRQRGDGGLDADHRPGDQPERGRRRHRREHDQRLRLGRGRGERGGRHPGTGQPVRRQRVGQPAATDGRPDHRLPVQHVPDRPGRVQQLPEYQPVRRQPRR